MQDVVVFQPANGNPVVVTDRVGKTIARGPEPGSSQPGMEVPTAPDGQLQLMHLVAGLDEEWQAVHCNVPGHGLLQVDVYRLPTDVVFIRIGTTIIGINWMTDPRPSEMPHGDLPL